MAIATTATVEEKLFEAMAELGADPAEIERTATLESLDIDSLDLVELAQTIEIEFGVQVSGDDARDLRTVADVIDLVVARAA